MSEDTQGDIRSTQFAGVAKLFLDELGDNGFIFEGADDSDREQRLEQAKMILARCLYDYTYLVVNEANADPQMLQVEFFHSHTQESKFLGLLKKIRKEHP